MRNITLKGVIDEDFVNYRVPSMTLMFPNCTFKCGIEYCQNSDLVVNVKSLEIDINKLCRRYRSNPITEAIVCQGMEPFDSYDELWCLIYELRNTYKCDDDIVIYTGYNKSEINHEVEEMMKFKNIIIKYGRYIPDQEPHYDEVLGVKLASDNQYAERIS